MYRWRKILGRIQMRMLLIVEKDVRSQDRTYPSLTHSSQEMSLIHGNVPAPKRSNNPPMRRSAPGGHNGRFEESFIIAIQLLMFVPEFTQIPELAKKVAKWSNAMTVSDCSVSDSQKASSPFLIMSPQKHSRD